MKFYNRKNELRLLSQVNEQSKLSSRFTVIVGRRRVGKTRLILKSVENKKFLYFFVAKKNEKLLCEEFITEAKNKLDIAVFGKISKFKDLFALLMETARAQSFTLIIDEFQEFNTINPSIYSDMQNIWDRGKEQSKMNLIVSGSVYSLMKKIFENSKEPLFGRANQRINLKPFDIENLKNILKENYANYSAKDLLSFYIFTGGVPKYIEFFIDKKAFTYPKMLHAFFEENSYLIDEGKNMLVEEFGKEYTTYFSILSLIASSKTSRTDIESILEKNIGGYLDRLETEYSIIAKVRPVLSKPGGRILKFRIEDNFLNFWFRFVYKNRSAAEIGNFDYIKNIVDRDFDLYSGKFLEKYFVQQLAATKKYAVIGNYWEKGNKNEIDIVAINPLEKKVLVAEVKLNRDKISIPKLKEKAKKISQRLPDYHFEYKALSIEDV